ncbi:MAG TPA: hypothetical protein EYN64_05525 [Flavobacteriales bacterium]|nr:hypothetical protein [Flavobacteriales bacterium]
MSLYQQLTLSIAFVVFSTLSGIAQTSNNSLLPYNPDVDGNGTIEVADLMGFLPLFSSPFIAEGTLPIANGGTGAANVDAARLALTISVFSDIVPLGDLAPSGLVSGDLVISGTLSQGAGSSATGVDAVATGNSSAAIGDNSHASNKNSVATGACSNAQGESTTATELASHSEGMLTYSSGLASHSEGMQTLAQGDYSHAEGFQSEATNISAHAEGYGTTASGLYSHAENRFSVATATCAHAEGESTSALADAAHSEGLGTTASGFASHAQGYNAIASGSYSHAGGRASNASATGSFATGHTIIADQQYSAVVGKFNLENRTGTLFAVGSGTSTVLRANTFEVSSGSALVNGTLSVTGPVMQNGIDLGTELQNAQQTILILQGLIADMQAQIDLLQP